jgi:hypothetical protein
MPVKDRMEIYYDVVSRILRDADGNELRASLFPKISFSQQAMVNLHLVTDAENTAYTELVGDETYVATLDNHFDSLLLMAQTLNTGINQAGDWGASGDADPTVGQISISLNAFTEGFQTKIGTAAELPGTMLELVVMDSAGCVLLVFRFSFRTCGLLITVTGTPGIPLGNFQWFIDPVSGAQCLRIVNDEGEVLSVLTPPGV